MSHMMLTSELLRRIDGINQQELARQLELNPTQIHEVENGFGRVLALKTLSKYYGCSQELLQQQVPSTLRKNVIAMIRRHMSKMEQSKTAMIKFHETEETEGKQ
jgi:DNA-binding XRE family transcriptional regulator